MNTQEELRLAFEELGAGHLHQGREPTPRVAVIAPPSRLPGPGLLRAPCRPDRETASRRLQTYRELHDPEGRVPSAPRNGFVNHGERDATG